jgi:hypothetical protein
MLLIAKIAKARKVDRDLSTVISILPMSDVIECGIHPISSMGFDN